MTHIMIRDQPDISYPVYRISKEGYQVSSKVLGEIFYIKLYILYLSRYSVSGYIFCICLDIRYPVIYSVSG